VHRCQDAKPVDICWGTANSRTDLSREWAEVRHIVGTCGGSIAAEQVFSDCRYVPSLRRFSRTKLCDGAQMAIFASFLRPVFPASSAQHISDLHSKFH